MPDRKHRRESESSNSLLVDNLHPGNANGARLDRAMVGAQRLDICTRYRAELERLADWLDRMDNNARVRVLIGMAAYGWRDWSKGTFPTFKSAYSFLAQYFRPNQEYDQTALPVLKRLARQEAEGRLVVRVRPPRAALDATLHVWTDVAGRQEAWHANMPQSDSTRDFVAWFDARWQEKDSIGGPKLVAKAQQLVADNGTQ
ncbi:MAG: hypothetical protein OXG36_14560 [Caldilineaceae bacterium]|nr:hypothetical protein [Caldilineaceae bacterium]